MTSTAFAFSGPLFVPAAIEDLELPTELLDVAGDPLSVVFAISSHVQRLPNGMSKLGPAVLERLDRSIERLALARPELSEKALRSDSTTASAHRSFGA